MQCKARIHAKLPVFVYRDESGATIGLCKRCTASLVATEEARHDSADTLWQRANESEAPEDADAYYATNIRTRNRWGRYRAYNLPLWNLRHCGYCTRVMRVRSDSGLPALLFCGVSCKQHYYDKS